MLTALIGVVIGWKDAFFEVLGSWKIVFVFIVQNVPGKLGYFWPIAPPHFPIFDPNIHFQALGPCGIDSPCWELPGVLFSAQTVGIGPIFEPNKFWDDE